MKNLNGIPFLPVLIGTLLATMLPSCGASLNSFDLGDGRKATVEVSSNERGPIIATRIVNQCGDTARLVIPVGILRSCGAAPMIQGIMATTGEGAEVYTEPEFLLIEWPDGSTETITVEVKQ